MISRSAEYSLRAVVCLAAHGEEPLKTHEIAAAARIPSGYLAKIMQALVRAGIVLSHRGVNGGFLLQRPASRLTLLEVVSVVDPPRRIATCPLGLSSHGRNLCSLHRHLDGAAALTESALSGVTVADVLAESTSPSPLCSCEDDSSLATANNGKGDPCLAR